MGFTLFSGFMFLTIHAILLLGDMMNEVIKIQEKTKNITKIKSITAVLKRIWFAFWLEASPYSLRTLKVKVEIAGEWLKEKTSTGKVSQTTSMKSFALGAVWIISSFQCGMR